jgi:hypothetical protein
MLTNAERRIVDTAIRAKTDSEIASIKNAKKGDKEAQAVGDAVLAYTVGQKVERLHLFVEQIHSFITDDGTIIEDRKSIERCVGLLLEPDEEEIAYQQEELKRTYRHSHFRQPHTCPECGYENVECA